MSPSLTKSVMKKPTPTTMEAMRGFLKKGEKATPKVIAESAKSVKKQKSRLKVVRASMNFISIDISSAMRICGAGAVRGEW